MLYSIIFHQNIWWFREEGVILHSLSGSKPDGGRKRAA